MKKIRPDYYSSISEMVAELNAKIPAEPKTINLHSDGFDIRFDHDSFSNKSIVTRSHEVLIKMEGMDLGIQLELKENGILHAPTPIVSPLMANTERYIASVICLHRYHSKSVSR